MRKSWKRALGFGVVAAASYAAWRAFESRNPKTSAAGWEAQPFPYPPQPRVPSANGTAAPWVMPTDDGTCPSTHPVKAKLASGIFHEPGGAFYDRTQADRCYLSTDAATADDLRPAKR